MPDIDPYANADCHRSVDGRTADRPLVKGLLRNGWMPYCCLAAACASTIVAAYTVEVIHKTREQARFHQSVEQMCEGIQKLMVQHLTLLDGLRGLASAKVKVTATQFYTYVDSLDVRERYPAVQGLGVIVRIPEDKKHQMVDSRRQTDATFAIRPESEGRDAFPVVYLAPQDDRNRAHVGFDMASEFAARAAIQRALRLGDIAVSHSSTSEGSSGQREFFVFAPLYRDSATPQTLEDRVAAAIGCVYCSFRAEDFFAALATPAPQAELSLTVDHNRPGSQGSLLYTSSLNAGQTAPGFLADRTIKVADQSWRLRFSALPAFTNGGPTNLAPFVLASGSAVSLLLFGISITQAKALMATERHARALRVSEAEFRSSFNSAAVGEAQIDPMTLRYLRVNPQFCSITGYNEEELLEMTFLDLNFPKDVNADTEAHQQLMSGEADQINVETTYLHKDGRKIWVNVCTSLIRDEAGRPVRTLAVVQDITARKEAEQALRLAELRYRTLAEQSITGIYVIKNDRFIYVNPKLVEIFGYSAEELTSAPLTEFILADDRPLVASNIQKRLSGEASSIHYMLRAVRRDGRVIDLEAHGARIEYDNAPAILGMLLDITERKQAEDRILNLNVQLEERVRVRTAELEAANKELESFSYSVSHDLRAPLRHIQGFIDLLVNETKDQYSGKSSRYVKIIRDTAVEMGDLVDDLLAFARVGRVEMRMTTVDMAQVMNTAIAGLEPQIAGRNIVWKKGCLAAVKADATLIKQVFVNLISNAVKYSEPRACAVIEIDCLGEDESGLVTFFVRDNGVGFDMQYAGKLFGVFQRLHRAEEFEGTGIGLANVSRIITRHGGRVWADAKLGEGATFFFTLKPSPLAHERAQTVIGDADYLK